LPKQNAYLDLITTVWYY